MSGDIFIGSLVYLLTDFNAHSLQVSRTRQDLSASCGAEAAITTIALCKAFYLVESNLCHRHYHQLGNAHSYFYVKTGFATIPARDEQLTLVV